MIQGEISTGRTGVWVLSPLISPIFVTDSQSWEEASPLSRLIPRHSQVEKRAGALHSFFPATLALDEKEATGQRGHWDQGKKVGRCKRRNEVGHQEQQQGARCDMDSDSDREQPVIMTLFFFAGGPS